MNAEEQKFKVNYPSDRSQIEFQNLLQGEVGAVRLEGHRSERLVVDPDLPAAAVLFFGFWIFLMNQVQGGARR